MTLRQLIAALEHANKSHIDADPQVEFHLVLCMCAVPLHCVIIDQFKDTGPVMIGLSGDMRKIAQGTARFATNDR